MKKLIACALFILIAGCASEAPKQTDYDKAVDDLYRAVVKYEIMHGTAEEQKPPITDEQVKALQNFMSGVDHGNVRDNVYKP